MLSPSGSTVKTTEPALASRTCSRTCSKDCPPPPCSSSYGIGLTPCDGTLFVSDHLDKEVWFFRIEKNHKLSMKAPYASLRIRGKNLPSRGDGCDADSLSRYYVTSDLGIQMFDPTGRLGGVISSPDPMKPVVSITFAGKDFQYLYVANGGTIYRRLMKVSGVGR